MLPTVIKDEDLPIIIKDEDLDDYRCIVKVSKQMRDLVEYNNQL